MFSWYALHSLIVKCRNSWVFGNLKEPTHGFVLNRRLSRMITENILSILLCQSLIVLNDKRVSNFLTTVFSFDTFLHLHLQLPLFSGRINAERLLSQLKLFVKNRLPKRSRYMHLTPSSHTFQSAVILHQYQLGSQSNFLN